MEPGLRLELEVELELAPAVGQLSTLSADLSSIKFMFSLIERRNSSGARPAYQRGECQKEDVGASIEQSPLQLTLHRRRPMAWRAWIVQWADVGTVACFISRDARCKMLLRRQSHGQDG